VSLPFDFDTDYSDLWAIPYAPVQTPTCQNNFSRYPQANFKPSCAGLTIEEPSRCYTECQRFWLRFAGKQVRRVASWLSNSTITINFGTRSSRAQTLPIFPPLTFPVPASSTGAADHISPRDITLQHVLYRCIWLWRWRERVGVVLTSAVLTATTVGYNEFEGAGHPVGKNTGAVWGYGTFEIRATRIMGEYCVPT
jgi:hypothetical protein